LNKCLYIDSILTDSVYRLPWILFFPILRIPSYRKTLLRSQSAIKPYLLGSLLSGNFWTLFFRFSGHFVSSQKYANIKKQLAKTKKRYVVFGEDTAKRLYGLSHEYWSHFVVFYNNLEDNTMNIFDPLKPILENEFGMPINTSYEADRLLFKLLIWKEGQDKMEHWMTMHKHGKQEPLERVS